MPTTKKTSAVESEAIEAAPAAVVNETAPETPRRRGLAIAGIVVGSVVAAGALFGGGVLLGANLPGTSSSQFGPGQFPEGGFPDGNGFPGGGQRPDMPGQGGTQGGTGS